jgi:hypothetical protein
MITVFIWLTCVHYHTYVHSYNPNLPFPPLRVYNIEVDCMKTSSDGLASIYLATYRGYSNIVGVVIVRVGEDSD